MRVRLRGWVRRWSARLGWRGSGRRGFSRVLGGGYGVCFGIVHLMAGRLAGGLRRFRERRSFHTCPTAVVAPRRDRVQDESMQRLDNEPVFTSTQWRRRLMCGITLAGGAAACHRRVPSQGYQGHLPLIAQSVTCQVNELPRDSAELVMRIVIGPSNAPSRPPVDATVLLTSANGARVRSFEHIGSGGARAILAPQEISVRLTQPGLGDDLRTVVSLKAGCRHTVSASLQVSPPAAHNMLPICLNRVGGSTLFHCEGLPPSTGVAE